MQQRETETRSAATPRALSRVRHTLRRRMVEASPLGVDVRAIARKKMIRARMNLISKGL